MPHELPAAVARILPAFLDDLIATLGSDLLGVYLYGSAIAGGFDPDASDVDVAIVMAPSTDEIDFAVPSGIVDRLQAREPDWAERLDILFIGRRTLAAFRTGGPLLSISHEIPLKRFDDAEAWLQTFYLVRSADTAAFGPPVTRVIPPISLEEFVSEVSRDAERLVRRAEEPECSQRVLAYTVLTLARIARVRETGEVVPKDDAARWLVNRTPDDREVIEAAIAVRHRQPAKAAWQSEWADRARDLIKRLGTEVRPAG